MMDALKRNSRDIHLVSGDGDAATREVARAIGLNDARGGLLPSDKAHYIDAFEGTGTAGGHGGRRHQRCGGHGPLPIWRWPFIPGRGWPGKPPTLPSCAETLPNCWTFFPLSRQVNRKVTQNLWCAWIYNLISIPIAMNGMLTPLVAATAMLLSSLTVIGNTLLLVRRD